ncbi:MAG TPA: Gfo/Idh/MocA family oxidoreductase, partial [Patescibacteria group bacterium]|nr:Gfo/Idh/MocA family oxidoreductase [Patescibacteria group bacterium]
LARLPHFDYVAACDLEESVAADCARRYGAGAVFTDYRRMLDDVRPEAVVVVGPPQLHLEAGLEAAARGIHLFVEKPSAPDLAGAEALADTVRKAGTVGLVGLFWRHAEAFQRAARLAADPAFGTTLLFDGLYLSPGPRVPLWGATDLAYSFLTDQAIHAVDAMRFLMGDVEELVARVGQGADGAFGYAVSLRFTSGAAGSLAVTSFTNAFSSRFTLHGSAGASLEITDAEALRLLARPALPGGRGGYVDQNLAEWRQGWSYAGHLRPGYIEELVAFARSIRDGFPASASLDDGAAALRVCEAILDSARTGTSVTFHA